MKIYLLITTITLLFFCHLPAADLNGSISAEVSCVPANYGGAFAQNTDSLTLKDFKIEDVYIPSREATVYELHLLESEEEVSVLLYTKPEEVVASYYDNQYLILVYRSGFQHYLTGVYKEEENWKQDYFHQMLGIITGMTSKVVKTATFIDGETLLLIYETSSIRESEKELSHSILRICKNQIYEYQRPDKPYDLGSKGNTSIRPID